MPSSSIPPPLLTGDEAARFESTVNSNLFFLPAYPFSPHVAPSSSRSIKPKPPQRIFTLWFERFSNAKLFPHRSYPAIALKIFPPSECPPPFGSFGRIDTPPRRSNCISCARTPLLGLSRAKPVSRVCPRTSGCRTLLARNRRRLHFPPRLTWTSSPFFWIGKRPPRASNSRNHSEPATPGRRPSHRRTLSYPLRPCLNLGPYRYLLQLGRTTHSSTPLARPNRSPFPRPRSQPDVCCDSPDQVDISCSPLSLSSRLARRINDCRHHLLTHPRETPSRP